MVSREVRADLASPHWPKVYGGRGATVMEQTIYRQEMVRARRPEVANFMGIRIAGPTLIHRVFPLRGSIRETVPSRLFATQTAPAPTATPLGPRPTGKVSAVETACGSIFASVRPELDVNQAASEPSATEAVSPEA